MYESLGDQSLSVLIFCRSSPAKTGTKASPVTRKLHITSKWSAQITLATMEGPRCRFLEKAACLVHPASLTTSSHLSSERLALIHYSHSEGGMQAANVCQRCGTIAASLWKPDSSTIKRIEKGDAGKVSPKPTPGKTVRRCGACGQVAKIPFDPNTKPSRSKKVQAPPSSSSEPKDRPSSPVGMQTGQKPKLSSKKRTKARKNREGLQTLLEKRKPTSTGSNLNLVDFLKP